MWLLRSFSGEVVSKRLELLREVLREVPPGASFSGEREELSNGSNSIDHCTDWDRKCVQMSRFHCVARREAPRLLSLFVETRQGEKLAKVFSGISSAFFVPGDVFLQAAEYVVPFRKLSAMASHISSPFCFLRQRAKSPHSASR